MLIYQAPSVAQLQHFHNFCNTLAFTPPLAVPKLHFMARNAYLASGKAEVAGKDTAPKCSALVSAHQGSPKSRHAKRQLGPSTLEMASKLGVFELVECPAQRGAHSPRKPAASVIFPCIPMQIVRYHAILDQISHKLAELQLRLTWMQYTLSITP